MSEQGQRENKRTNIIGNRVKQVENLVIDTSRITAENRQNPWILVMLSIISVFSGYMGFSDGFEIGSSLFLVLITTVVFSVTTQILLVNSKRIKLGLPILLGVIGIYVAITSSWTINGITLIMNKVISYVNEQRAEIHLKYVASYKNPTLDMAMATIVLCAVYTILFNVLLKYRRIYLCAIMLLTCSMTNMFIGGPDQYLWVAMTLICTFTIFYISNIRIFRIKKGLSLGSVMLIILVMISAVFVGLVRYSGIRSVDELKDEIIYQAGNVIYGKSDYPEGQFKRFEQYPEDDGEVRLTVSMTNPVSLRLKGYVGCQYTKKGWKGNDESIYGGDNLGMMEWFLEQGYYPLTQLAYYMGYSRNDGRNIEFDKVKNSGIYVVNNTASKKFEYVPENLLDMSGLIAPKQDVNFVESDIFGEDEYWYDILYFTEDDYLNFPSQEWFTNSSTATAEQQQFIQAENYYHGFASTYYMEIPDEEKRILQQNIPECTNNVSDALWTVRNYLKNQMSYSKECASYNPDKNYLQQVMLEEKKGYSVHFATVATLMFRYYGVPARYVEGYLSFNENKKESVEMKSTNAHAWVEVYVKGMGFIPVEVTPGFYQEDEAGGNTVPKENNSVNKGGEGSSGTKNNEKEHMQITWELILTILLYLFIVVSVAFIITLLIRRKVVISDRKRKLVSDDPYVVVAAASQYIDDVCVFCRTTIQNEIPEDIRIILEKIKFSNRPLHNKEKDSVVDCMNIVTAEKWEEQSPINKLIMMFWKCLK